MPEAFFLGLLVLVVLFVILLLAKTVLPTIASF